MGLEMIKLKDILNEKSGDFYYYPLKNKHGEAKLFSRQNKPFGFYLEVKPKTRKEYTMDLPSAIKNFQKASRWFKANIGKRFLVPTNEATTKWSGLSLSQTQIPAVATRQRKDVEKLLKKLRIPIKPHEVKGAPQRTIYAMDKKHIMTFVKAMDNADMFWYIPMGGSSGPRSKIGKPIK